MRWIFVIAVCVVLGHAAALAAAEQIKPGAQAPEFAEGDEWIDAKPLKLADLRGHVVVVHFWTFACINCQHNLPHYNAWQDKFAKQGVVIVGVHTPELPEEEKPENVRREVTARGIKYPVLIDNGRKNWQAWGNSVWPTVYVVDKQGRFRWGWQGELNWQDAKGEAQMRDKIEELLKEPAPAGEQRSAAEKRSAADSGETK